MPTAAIRQCSAFGCGQPADTCTQHSRKAQQHAYDARRGSAHSRGYGVSWRRYTDWYRHELVRQAVPRALLCGARLKGAPVTQDSRCAQQGLITIGHVVDHIIPVTGPDDPRFYDPLNHQLLCDGRGQGCHDSKRQRERVGGRR